MYTLQQAKVFTLHEPFKLNYLVYKNYVISYWSQGESSVYVAVLKGAGQPCPNFFLFVYFLVSNPTRLSNSCLVSKFWTRTNLTPHSDNCIKLISGSNVVINYIKVFQKKNYIKVDGGHKFGKKALLWGSPTTITTPKMTIIIM